MIKHILGQALWQCGVLFFILFYGENIIPESEPKFMFDRQTGYVYPGRAEDWDGTPLYTKEKMDEFGASRHMTFIFTTFVMM